jgi:hypothetical protein
MPRRNTVPSKFREKTGQWRDLIYQKNGVNDSPMKTPGLEDVNFDLTSRMNKVGNDEVSYQYSLSWGYILPLIYALM